MTDTNIITRTGKGSALSAGNNDQNLDSLSGVVETVGTATHTVSAADQNKVLVLNNAAMVCTLPTESSMLASIKTSSFCVTFRNLNAVQAKIQASAGNTINGRPYIYLPFRHVVTLYTAESGTGWMVCGGAPPINMAFITESSATGKTINLISNHTLDRNIYFPDATGTLALNAESGTGAIFNRPNPKTPIALSSVQTIGLTGTVQTIDIAFSGVSCNAAAYIRVRLGSSNVLQATGYVAGSLNETGGTTDSAGINLDTSGGSPAAADTFSGVIILRHVGSNVWSWTGNVHNSSVTAAHKDATLSGTVTLSGACNIVGFAAASGNFDSGTAQAFVSTSG